MAERKDSDGYPCKPRHLPSGAWFYEQREGIVVVIENRQCDMPWRRVAAALRHHEAAKANRKK
jgi:hypothetical protein